MRYLWLAAVLLISVGVLAQNGLTSSVAPVSAKRSIVRLSADHTATTATIKIYFDDQRALVIFVPEGGNVVQAAAAPAPGGKLSNKADATATLSLVPSAIPGSDILDVPIPAPVAPPVVQPTSDKVGPPMPTPTSKKNNDKSTGDGVGDN